MILAEDRDPWRVALVVAALVALRLGCAAFTPLAFDEAYYWTWSKHLAGGYYDHPPMVAAIVALGTAVAGDTEFGVRMVSILLAIPMSWATYRAALLLFEDRALAASAALLLNATLMVSVGTLVVTPDAPLMTASSLILLGLAQVLRTGRGVWWLAVGAAAGVALLSKYTALFFGPAILLWLVAVPSQRRWLASPWPYLGGLVALAVFAPVIAWNAEHQWVSFIKQFGRSRSEGLTLAHIGYLVPTQIGLATPFVFLLGALGLAAMLRRGARLDAANALIGSLFWVITLYFAWHSLHNRVEANWFGPVYPAFAIAAAVAVHQVRWRPRLERATAFCRRWALPCGTAIFVLLFVQANTGALTGFRRDPTARTIGVGWRDLARDIEALRVKTEATCILAPTYGTTSWLMFYMPKGTCVVQPAQRIRWLDVKEPDPGLLRGKVLLVDEVRPDRQTALKAHYARIDKIADLTRKRGRTPVQSFEVELLQGATGDVIDRSPPIEVFRGFSPASRRL